MPQPLRAITLFCFTLLLLLLVYSCGKNKDTSPEPVNPDNSPGKPTPGLYVSGYYSLPGSNDSGYVWKENGSLYFKSYFSYVTNITANKGDLYTGGQWSGDPAYWKNGLMTKLSSPGAYAIAHKIAVVANDVYVLGAYLNLTNNSTVSFYWKNNVIKSMKDTLLSDITASGNDIYMVGSVSGRYFYKKNNTLNFITNFTPNKISVSGSDVYLSGYAPAPAGSSDVIYAYWKNGTIVKLGQQIYLTSLFTKGNDVYLTGQDLSSSGQNDTGWSYWKNGVVTRLDPNLAPTSNGKATSIDGIFIDKSGNIYIAGTSRYGSKRIGSLWKNGIKIDLTPASDAVAISGVVMVE